MAPRRRRRQDITLADLFALAQAEAARGYEENPAEGTLDEALRRLGYSAEEWSFVDKHYALIYSAFANRVGALDFATGVHGKALAEPDEALVAEVKRTLNEAISLGSLPLGLVEDLDVAAGKLVASKQGKSRTYRLGKLLKQAGATSTLLRKFETRQVALDWEITSDPMEVASMSYGRAWVSCMAPGGAYKRGPISDVRAGSALILFFRPGADEPCGREVIRPSARVTKGKPRIIRSGVTYGTAAVLSDEEISAAIEQQTGLAVKVVTGELSSTDGPYFGVYDDAARSDAPVDAYDIPPLTEALRKTWSRFVDLPEPSAGGLEPSESDSDVEFDQAVDVAQNVLAQWNDQPESNVQAVATPADRGRLALVLAALGGEEVTDFPVEAFSGFDEGIARRAWTHVLATSQHHFIALVDPVFDFGADEVAAGVSHVEDEDDLDEDYWYPNYRTLVNKHVKLGHQNVPHDVLRFTLPNWEAAREVIAHLEADSNVYYWEVVGIG